MQTHPQSRKSLPSANLIWWPKHHTLNTWVHRRVRAAVTETSRLSEAAGVDEVLAITV